MISYKLFFFLSKFREMTAKRLLNGFRRGCSSSAIDRKSGSNVKFSKEKKLFGRVFFSLLFFLGKRKEGTVQ